MFGCNFVSPLPSMQSASHPFLPGKGRLSIQHNSSLNEFPAGEHTMPRSVHCQDPGGQGPILGRAGHIFLQAPLCSVPSLCDREKLTGSLLTRLRRMHSFRAPRFHHQAQRRARWRRSAGPGGSDQAEFKLEGVLISPSLSISIPPTARSPPPRRGSDSDLASLRSVRGWL